MERDLFGRTAANRIALDNGPHGADARAAVFQHGTFEQMAAPVSNPGLPPVGTSNAFSGTPGDDNLVGTSGDDTFDISQGGKDTVTGNGGDDYVTVGAALTATDSIDGGADNSATTFIGDTVELTGDYSGGLTLSNSTLHNIENLQLDGASFGGGDYVLTLANGNVAAGASLTVNCFQSSSGTSFFHIDGSAETNGNLGLSVFGRGDDILIGGSGNDFINGGVSGTDTLDGGGGWNRVSFTRAITGTSGGVTVSLTLQGAAQDVGAGRMVTLNNFQGLGGSNRSDVLTGDDNANYIAGNGGSDAINGAGGDDVVFIIDTPAPISVSADGGDGIDILTGATTKTVGLTFSLALQGTAQIFEGTASVVATNFEGISGFDLLDDTLSGNSGANMLYGNGGNDTLVGANGDNSLYGDRGYGLLGSGSGSGLGSFVRGDGNDVLRGGKGNDLLDGGAGLDTADYTDATGGVHVSLTSITAQKVGGGLGHDTFVGIENLKGSGFDDTLSGNGAANALIGAEGDDTLAGGDSNDFLYGEDDSDALDGGHDDDVLFGGAEGDTLSGGDGNDILYGDMALTIVATGPSEILSTNDDGDPGNNASFNGALSSDGSHVAFRSWADNLDGPDDGESTISLYIKDLDNGDVTRITFNGGEPISSFSPDGSHLVFQTEPTLDVFVYDVDAQTITRVSESASGESDSGSTNGVFVDDKRVAFDSSSTNLIEGDTNGFGDVFIKDIETGEVAIVSVRADGEQGDSSSYRPGVSADGTKIVFTSNAGNLVDGDTNGVSDIFLKDLVTGELTRVSTADQGEQANGESDWAVISADGTQVAFLSTATNLAGDTGGSSELFVKNLVTGEIKLSTASSDGDLIACNPSHAAFSPDGRYLAFDTFSPELVPGKSAFDIDADIFVTDLLTGVITRISNPDGSPFDMGAILLGFSADGRDLLVNSATDFTGQGAGYQICRVALGFASDPTGGDDVLNGGSGADILAGGAGADTMNGGKGADIFQYDAVSDSTSTTFDTVTAFNAHADQFDVFGGIDGVDAAFAGGTLSAATFDGDLAAAVDAAHLAAHHAVVFAAGGGDFDGDTFLVVDANNAAGYQAGEDFVVRLDSAKHLDALSVDSFT